MSDLVQYIRTLDNAQFVFMVLLNLASSRCVKGLEIYETLIRQFWTKSIKTTIK